MSTSINYESIISRRLTPERRVQLYNGCTHRLLSLVGYRNCFRNHSWKSFRFRLILQLYPPGILRENIQSLILQKSSINGLKFSLSCSLLTSLLSSDNLALEHLETLCATEVLGPFLSLMSRRSTRDKSMRAWINSFSVVRDSLDMVDIIITTDQRFY